MIHRLPWWDLDSSDQARALAWARVKASHKLSGISSTPATIMEHANLLNGPDKKSKKPSHQEGLDWLGS